MACQNRTIAFREREAGSGAGGKLVVEIGKDVRHDRDHDHAREFAVASGAPAADAEKGLFSHTRLQYSANVSAHVAVRLGEEIVAVGNAYVARNREDGRRDK